MAHRAGQTTRLPKTILSLFIIGLNIGATIANKYTGKKHNNLTVWSLVVSNIFILGIHHYRGYKKSLTCLPQLHLDANYTATINLTGNFEKQQPRPRQCSPKNELRLLYALCCAAEALSINLLMYAEQTTQLPYTILHLLTALASYVIIDLYTPHKSQQQGRAIKQDGVYSSL